MTANIPREWLRTRGTPEEFERAQLEQKAAAFNLPFDKVADRFGAQPFAHLTDKWREFVKQMMDGDELWSFSSPEETFAKKLGCKGYAIMRNGQITATFVTLRT